MLMLMKTPAHKIAIHTHLTQPLFASRLCPHLLLFLCSLYCKQYGRIEKIRHEDRRLASRGLPSDDKR